MHIKIIVSILATMLLTFLLHAFLSIVYVKIPKAEWIAKPIIQLCDDYNDDVINDILASDVFSAKYALIEHIDLCMCDIALQPDDGAMQITGNKLFAYNTITDEDGIFARTYQNSDGKIVSACIYTDAETLSKMPNDVAQHVVKHEIGHGFGYHHAVIQLSENFSIAAWYHLMTNSYTLSGNSTKNM